MHIIFRYDLERLTAYRDNPVQDNRIVIGQRNRYNLFAFPEVSYFNYTWVEKGVQIEMDELAGTEDFYVALGIPSFRILVPETDEESCRAVMSGGKYRQKGSLVITGLRGGIPVSSGATPAVEHLPVTPEYLPLFTDLYLSSFEAAGRDLVKVASNFSRLLEVEGLRLYIVRRDDKPAGIGIIYKSGRDCFLAGGAVLPVLRNRGIHKKSLALRIATCQGDPGCDRIVSWAYRGSISLANMKKLGMEEEESWSVYEYCG